MRIPSLLLLSGLSLALLVGCGGGSTSTPAPTQAAAAKGLTYTNPTSTGWRFVKDASSTSTRLVLNLVGPAGFPSRGVGFNLQGGEGVTFAAFPTGLPLQDTGVYQLRALGSTDPAEPVALTGGVLKGNVLSAGIYQKDRDQGARNSGVALCQIALTLDPAAHKTAGTPLTLSVLKAKAIPEDIGRVDDDLDTLDRKMRMVPVSIALGTLTAQ